MRMAPLSPDGPAPKLSGTARVAGVLLLLFPGSGGLSFFLTRRTETVATHKGQISLPGGAREKDESAQQASLRETCEEIGVCRDDIEIVGTLTPLYVIVSDFYIHPFVGYLSQRPEVEADPVEVAQVIEMPLAELLDESIKVIEQWDLSGFLLDVPFYRVGGLPVWGATAIMLSEFEVRLRAVMGVV
jgi:8-oxo-dGTP pyrophosphatase MutT (NUDIX family)